MQSVNMQHTRHMNSNHQQQQKPVILNGKECDSDGAKHQEPSKDPPEADFKCPSLS